MRHACWDPRPDPAPLQATTDRVNSFRDDVDLLKSEVASAAAERMQQRAANAVFSQQLSDKERALEGARKALEAMRAKLNDAGSAAASTEAGLGEQVGPAPCVLCDPCPR